jgi:hypothetical protein
MMRKLLPLFLGLFGLSLGAAAGFVLRPAQDPSVPAGTKTPATEQSSDPATPKDYAKLANQFIIPVLAQGKVSALMVLSLSLEVRAGTTAQVNAAEPKLRDAFLQVMFDHANSGGFSGSYTDAATLIPLRTALLEVAKSVLGDKVSDVLITDILRRDG